VSSKPKVSGIYKILNTVTGDFYIGSSKDCAFRWQRHRWLLKQGIHHNQHLQRAWAKYGRDAFTFDVVIEVTVEQLVETEQSFLDQYLPTYNISKSADRPSGTLGRRWKLSEESRRRISLGHIGLQMTEEHLANMRKPRSEETKAKMRKPKSDEHRRKLAAHLVSARVRSTTPEAIAKRLETLKRNREAAVS
jgi:group I intron endonuclease